MNKYGMEDLSILLNVVIEQKMIVRNLKAQIVDLENRFNNIEEQVCLMFSNYRDIVRRQSDELIDKYKEKGGPQITDELIKTFLKKR